MAFIRQYGMAGDPKPGRNVPKRKAAAAGPKVKAQRKRNVRAQRAARGTQGSAKGPGKKGKGPGIDIGALVKKYGPGALDLAQQFVPGGAIASKLGLNVSGLLPGQAPDLPALPASGGGKAKHARQPGEKGRRTRNPANVKALRKALGRVEGFGRLVKRVNRMLPTAHRFQVHPVMKHKRKRRSA